jgi:GxxExxY protein
LHFLRLAHRADAADSTLNVGVGLALRPAMELYSTPLGRKVIGCAIEVHAVLGPGLLESVFQRALAHEFTLQGLPFIQQVPLPVAYKGLDLGTGYRIDFIVDGELVVELKTVERFLPIHDAQVMTYLRALDLRQGLLINFNVGRLVDGVRSILNAKATRRSTLEVEHPL